MRLALQLVELERGVREVSLRRGDLEQRRARQVRAGRVVEQGQAEIHVLELDRVELLRLLLLRVGRPAPHRRGASHHGPCDRYSTAPCPRRSSAFGIREESSTPHPDGLSAAE